MYKVVHSERAGGGMSGHWTRGSIGGFSLEGCDVIVGSVVEVGVLEVGREGRDLQLRQLSTQFVLSLTLTPILIQF